MRVVGDILRLNAKRFPNRIALVMDDRHFTYQELNQQVNQLAHGLISLRVKPMDKVAVLANNSPEWVIIAYAVAKCGAAVVPVNYRYKKDELVHVVNNSECSAIFFGPEFAALVDEATPEFERSPHLIPLAGEAMDTGLSFTGLVKDNPTSEPPIEVNPEWPVSLTYTSGTTGRPKGVLASHFAFLNIYVGLVVEGGVGDDEIILVSLPFFHVSGLHALVQPTFLRGGTVVIAGGGFDPDKVLHAVARHKVTMTMWVPTQLAMLVNSSAVSRYDVSSLKKIWYGSSPITPPVLEASMEQFGASFYQWYGQTETGMVSVLPPQDHFGERAQFTGREFFNADLRIVDESDNDVPVGGVGEIVSCQTGLGMIGYHNLEMETRATVRNGWIHTGDVGRAEGNGYFTIVDRIKDMIISGAENIYPKEIEDVISRHPKVREVAVFGIPDDVYGESVCAAIVPKPDSDVQDQEIIDFCASRLSGYKKPKRVIVVTEMPKNAFGKVTKNILREPFWAGRGKRI